MPLNPANDDLGSSWTKSRPEPKQTEKEGPAESYVEKDERHWRVEELWGPQEKTARPKPGKAGQR